MGWIEENYKAYLRNHSISLIVGAATSSDDNDISVSELVENVKRLYRETPASDGYL
jgi:hypothetical protein